ncbi:zinc finger protein 691-like isoform X2 [Rana temporaria]|uniref:zinc finger protein 691-like isoform X2 n=1 Tax=Rana temporaria TaxID=8407 RepID=UPI001AACB10D|nr:zinc finger protein 691-like isoform X2 [Rana temporaria]
MMDNQPPLTSPDGCENQPDSGDRYFPMVTSDTETDDSMVIDEGPESIDPYEDGPGPQGIDPYEDGPGPQGIHPYEEGPGPQGIHPYEEGPGPQGIHPYEDTGPQDIDSYEDMGLEIIYPYHGDMEPEGLDPYEGDTGPKGIDPYEGDTGSEAIDLYEGDTGPKGIDPYKRGPGMERIDPYEGHTGPKGKDPCKVATTTSSMKGFPIRIKQEPVSDEDDGVAGKNFSNQIAYSCVRIKEEPQMYVEVKIPSEGEDRTPQAYCHIKVETVPAEEADPPTPIISTPGDQGHSTAAHIKEEPVAFRNVSDVSQQANPTPEQPSKGAAQTTSYKVETRDKAPEKASDNSSLYSVRQKEDSMEILYHCPSCFKGFSSNLDLARHQVIHTVSKLFICSLCGKSFTEMSFLVKHQVIHTDLKLCVCPVCGGCFYSETSLAKHQKTHSLPLFCSTCGKCFFNKTELAMHERKHSGERPFGCHVCGKHFIAKSVLNKHMMIHGPTDIAK